MTTDMKCSESENKNPGVGAIDNPLDDYARQFRSHMERQYYCPARITQYVLGIDALGRFLKTSNVAVNDLDEDRAVDLLMRSDGSLRWKKRTVFIVRSFVRFLQELGVAKPTVPMASDDTARGRLRLEYEEHLCRQRGLSERTIVHCWRFADRFLSFHFNSGEVNLSQITASDISRFMQHLTSRGTPLRDKTPPTHLRNFFRFLFQSGKTAINLAPSVPRIAHRHGATLPRHLMPEQVGEAARRCPARDAHRAAQLRHGAAAGPVGPASARGDCDANRRHRLAGRRVTHSREGQEARQCPSSPGCGGSSGGIHPPGSRVGCENLLTPPGRTRG
jgi:hypothetical protein